MSKGFVLFFFTPAFSHHSMVYGISSSAAFLRAISFCNTPIFVPIQLFSLIRDLIPTACKTPKNQIHNYQKTPKKSHNYPKTPHIFKEFKEGESGSNLFLAINQSNQIKKITNTHCNFHKLLIDCKQESGRLIPHKHILRRVKKLVTESHRSHSVFHKQIVDRESKQARNGRSMDCSSMLNSSNMELGDGIYYSWWWLWRNFLQENDRNGLIPQVH